MISRASAAAALLISLPALLSGEEFSVKRAVVTQKKFVSAEQFSVLKSEPHRQFAAFTHQKNSCFAVLETVPTKSGTITYLSIYDQSQKTVHFTVTAYTNRQNASLTSAPFLNQFKNRQPALKSLRRGTDIDAVSGATLSTESLISAVNRSSSDLKRMISEK